MLVIDKEEAKKINAKSTKTNQIITDGLAVELGFLLAEQDSHAQTIDSFIEQLSQASMRLPASIGLNESTASPINDWLAATAEQTNQASLMLADLTYKVDDQPNANSMANPLKSQQDFSENYVFPESYIDDTE